MSSQTKPTTRKTSTRTKTAAPKTTKTATSSGDTPVETPVETPAETPVEAAVPAANTAPPKVVTSQEPVITGPDLRKKELIDLVVERSGVKKKDAKPVVEAMLAVLGETLEGGRQMNLQPFARMTISRVKTVANGKVYITRLRRREIASEETDPPLAHAAE